MFTLYTTSPKINTPSLLSTLNKGILPDAPTSGPLWSASPTPFPPNTPPSQILHHHRTQPPPDSDETYLLIADDPDWPTAGLLAITLNYSGYLDAARVPAPLAGSALPSASIANTSWPELLSDALLQPLYPRGRFAVYATPDVAEPGQRGGLVESLNFGLESRKEFAPGVCRLVEGERRCDVEGIVGVHGRVAGEGGFEAGWFVVVDDVGWEDVGVEIVKVGGEGGWEVVAKPVDVAAEVLTWVVLGLMDWEEGKGWDEDRVEED